ncbi:MAG: hypothetical protein ACO4AV_15930 [bacterium]
MAKRPWLLTPKGQKISLFLAFVISVVAIAPAVIQVASDSSREVTQLDPTDVSYCELSACGEIEKIRGLVVTDEVTIKEVAYGTSLKIRLINGGRLTGARDVWAQVRTLEGSMVEGMRTRLILTDQGPQHVEFQFSGKPSELAKLRVFLGF